MNTTETPQGNAWLEKIEHRGAELRVRVAIKVGLRGARTPRLSLRRPNGGPLLVGPIAASKVDTGGGRVSADFRIPIAAALGHADPRSMVGAVMEAAVELAEGRHAWIDLPHRFRGFGFDQGDRRLSLRAASDGIMTVRDRRAVRMPALARPAVTRVRRIMIFAGQVEFRGGKTKAILQLAGMLAEAGHQVTIVALWASDKAPLFSWPERVGFDHIDGGHIAVPADAETGPSVFAKFNPKATGATDERLASYLRGCDFDLIYVPNYDCGIYGIFAENSPAGTVLVIGDHNGAREAQARSGRVDRDFLAAIRSFDAVHSVNAIIAEALGPLTAREVFVIPNTAERSAAAERDAAFFATRRIVSIGRLVPGKQMDHVIDAFALIVDRFPDWRLDIFGEGTEAPALAERIAASGLADRAVLRGFDPAVGATLEAGAVLVSGSRTEAHPLVMIEAMAAGCPVVSYDRHCGARALIVDGVTGFLATDGVRSSLAARMAEVMSRIEEEDPALLDVIAAARASTKPFERDQVMAQWLAKVDELCGRKRLERPRGILDRLRRAAALFRPRSRDARATPRAT